MKMNLFEDSVGDISCSIDSNLCNVFTVYSKT